MQKKPSKSIENTDIKSETDYKYKQAQFFMTNVGARNKMRFLDSRNLTWLTCRPEKRNLAGTFKGDVKMSSGRQINK